MSVTGTPLFGRRARLVISSRQKVGKAAATAPVTVLEVEGGRDAAGKRTGLAIRWQHKKSWIPAPNNGHVEVDNLGEESRKLCTKERFLKAAVFAGYGEDLRQVFAMDIRQANSKWDGTTWTTKLEGGDGAAAWTHAHANVSFGKNSKVVDVALGLIDKAGFKKLSGVSIKELNSAAAGKIFKQGYAANGNAAFELNAVLRSVGLSATIQDDELVVSKADKPTAEIFLWSPTTGLIGSPEYASPPQPGKPQLLKIKGLLNPVLKVRAKLALESQAHKGEYLIREITHSGDTHGGDWYTEVNALPLSGAT